MRRLVRFSFIALLAVGLFSCDLNDDDHYSLDKFWVGFGLVDDFDDSATFTVKMDDGSILFPVNSYYSASQLDEYDRVLVNYTIIGDKRVDDENKEYYVKINSLKDILFKGILDITAENEDSIGNDPIHVDELWLSDNLLTFELDYYGYDKVHFINLVKQPGDISGMDELIELELRHNDQNDDDSYQLSALVTFDLSALQITGKDSIQFKVTGDEFEGEDFSFTGVYRY